jgi:hypothetical protein
MSMTLYYDCYDFVVAEMCALSCVVEKVHALTN